MQLDSNIQSKIDYYLAHEQDTFFVKQIQQLQSQNDNNELYDRFYTELEFGTGGIRGILEGGTNRLNPLIVQKVASGWVEYLLKCFPDVQIKVVLAYDSRRYSKEFADIVSSIACAKGIMVYRYPHPRATPQLSFTIRALHAQSGMVITASHNPPQYNGLKVYWDDGGQVVSPHDVGIIERIQSVTPPFSSISIKEAKEQKLYEELGQDFDEKFQDYVSALMLESNTLHQAMNYKVVYTPLHGTGAHHLEALMKQHEIDYVIEPSQKEPDGEFPTVAYPNPEDPKALYNAVETAKKVQANLVIATDPDADRMGVVERIGDDFIYLSGNQIGALLLDYIVSRKKEHGLLGKKGIFINTVVTSLLQEKIAASYDIATAKVYTGFKNIAEYMKKIESEHMGEFVFSCEESYGFLSSMAVRDKDGISTSMLCIDMAKFYASQGMSLVKKLEDLYIKHGYHEERAINKQYTGKEGKDTMQSIMKKLRENSPTVIGNQKIILKTDYKTGVIHDMLTNSTDTTGMRSIDVLIFTTELGNKICIRPSGTEPKIKLYLLYSLPKEKSKDLEQAKKQLQSELDIVEKEVQTWLV